MAISMMALFGTIILLPIYMQNVLGLDVLQHRPAAAAGRPDHGAARARPSAASTTASVRGAADPRIDPRVHRALVLDHAPENTSFWWVLAAHMTLSIGLALLFTPLFTAGLGSLRPHLYSHGSAIVGTVQQVAGAAGATLFVTVMAAQAATLAGGGASEVAAASGVRLAFLVGAIISLLAIPAAASWYAPRRRCSRRPMEARA